MNKKQAMFILSPIVIVLLTIGLYVWSQTGIEGWYRASVSGWLDGSRWYIQLRNGEIRSHSQSSTISETEFVEIVGSYKPLENDWYELIYDKGQFLNRKPIRIRAKGGLKGLTCNLDDLQKLDMEIGVHKRLHFWDFW